MRGTFPQAFPSPFPSKNSFMKKILVVCFVLIIAVSCFVLPASAASYEINVAYNEFNIKRFDFYVKADELWQETNGGPFWNTSVKPGYMVYNSGALLSQFDNKAVEITAPGISFDKAGQYFYINDNASITVSGEIILYSKNQGRYTDLKFIGGFGNSDGDYVEFTSTSVWIDPRIYYTSATTQIYVPFEVTIYTNSVPENGYLFDIYPVLKLDDIGTVADLGNTAVGVGFFNPGLTIRNGDKENAPIYQKPSSDAIDKESQLTGEIENQTSAGISTSTDLFTDFNSTIGAGTQLYNGISAVTLILNEFLNIDFVSDLLNFSLVLGLFSFLLGMGFFVSSFVSNKRGPRKEAREAHKNRYQKKGG